VYDCEALLGLYAAAWIVGNAEHVPASFMVEATLTIVEHPASVAPDSTSFAAFSE
jgi:hypothetical protein